MTVAETPGAVESLATLHKALADPIRLTILRLLLNETFGVLELCRVMDFRQSALSHHLKILANAQLVSTRREGNSIFYRRAFISEDDPHRLLKTAVFEQIDALPLAQSLTRMISQIQLERSQLSLSFFNRHASKFREKQGLIVAHTEYAANLHDVINELRLPPDAPVLEIGPGEGQLLVELAGTFTNLIALDNSSDMLARSQEAVHSAGFEHVHFLLGDSSVACQQRLEVDLILLEMVLHHISSPAQTFRDCAELLRPGGFLLIVDLAPHDQDWVRESCGDLWLGFEKQELERWATEQGLVCDQGTFLQLRNGFQIQIRVFHKKTHDA